MAFRRLGSGSELRSLARSYAGLLGATQVYKVGLQNRSECDDGSKSFSSVVVFGDSYSDAGVHGFGNVNMNHAEAGGYPAAALKDPMHSLKAKFGSYYPFPQFGYVDYMATNGDTWAKALESVVPSLRVWNFAHTSGSSCQHVDENGCVITPPPSFHGVWTDSGLGLLRPRGVAQQLKQALSLMKDGHMPSDIFQSSLVVVFIGTNDFLYTWSSANCAVGKNPAEAKHCALVLNYAAIYKELVHVLGVPPANIIFAGLPAIEMLPMVRKNFPHSKDIDAIVSQVDAVNEQIEHVAKRWQVAEWMRQHMAEKQPTVISYVYDKLGGVSGPEHFPTTLPVVHGHELWFDEIHPSAKVHRAWAEHFARHYLNI